MEWRSADLNILTLTIHLLQEEKIGDVFVSCFSKSVVLEVYSDFINNFNQAMEMAKSESKRKSAFADFLKVEDGNGFLGKMI